MYFEHKRLYKYITSKGNPLPSPCKTDNQKMIVWHKNAKTLGHACGPHFNTGPPFSPQRASFKDLMSFSNYQLLRSTYWGAICIHLFPTVNYDEKQYIYSKHSLSQKEEKATVGFPEVMVFLPFWLKSSNTCPLTRRAPGGSFWDSCSSCGLCEWGQQTTNCADSVLPCRQGWREQRGKLELSRVSVNVLGVWRGESK